MKAGQRGRDRTERGPPSKHILFGVFFRPESPHPPPPFHNTHTHLHPSLGSGPACLRVGFIKLRWSSAVCSLSPLLIGPAPPRCPSTGGKTRRKVNGCCRPAWARRHIYLSPQHPKTCVLYNYRNLAFLLTLNVAKCHALSFYWVSFGFTDGFYWRVDSNEIIYTEHLLWSTCFWEFDYHRNTLCVMFSLGFFVMSVWLW